MARIVLTTDLPGPPERCFDLARSVELHRDSMAGAGERPLDVAGSRTSGLLQLGDTVTWEARHLGRRRRLTRRFTEFDRPHHFVDEMVPGMEDFRSFRHEHRFAPLAADGPEPGTRMTDEFDFESPLGAVGRAVNALFLTGYLRRLLERRKACIVKVLRSGDWERYLS